jgi:prepilin-type N-terminal cleavage/methylation domain-containing protein
MTLKRATGSADQESMESAPRKLSDERGYTLVELLVAAFVLVIGMAGAFTLLNGANRASTTNNARMGATNLGRELLEDARSVEYDSLKPSTITGVIQAKAGVTGNPSPWVVFRRGIQYTATLDVCTFDDPKDNVAATPPANVCTPQAPVPASAGTLDPEIQPDDFRRVTVTIAWNTGNGDQSTKLVSLINNPSGGLGPRIITFDPPVKKPDGSPAQLDSGIVATFPTVTTNAGSVRWNSDGTPNGSGDSTLGPTTWDTTWQLGTKALAVDPVGNPTWATTQFTPASTVLDGTYTVTAQAFDELGIAGDSRAAVLPLNRSEPITVTGFEAGRNFNVSKVEFQWNENPEHDIIGYKVYETGPDNVLGNGNDTLVCSTSSGSATSCTASMPGTNPTYAVVAVDLTDITDTGSLPRESDFGQTQTISSTEPDRPDSLAVGADPSTGKPQLSWAHPNVSAVRYFRIYRDACCSPADRYDVTKTNATTYTDPAAPSGTHRYWVTAVGPGISESQPSNNVDYLVP